MNEQKPGFCRGHDGCEDWGMCQGKLTDQCIYAKPAQTKLDRVRVKIAETRETGPNPDDACPTCGHRRGDHDFAGCNMQPGGVPCECQQRTYLDGRWLDD
jgi:hypothetical protein